MRRTASPSTKQKQNSFFFSFLHVYPVLHFLFYFDESQLLLSKKYISVIALIEMALLYFVDTKRDFPKLTLVPLTIIELLLFSCLPLSYVDWIFTTFLKLLTSIQAPKFPQYDEIVCQRRQFITVASTLSGLCRGIMYVYTMWKQITYLELLWYIALVIILYVSIFGTLDILSMTIKQNKFSNSGLFGLLFWSIIVIWILIYLLRGPPPISISPESEVIKEDIVVTEEQNLQGLPAFGTDNTQPATSTPIPQEIGSITEGELETSKTVDIKEEHTKKEEEKPKEPWKFPDLFWWFREPWSVEARWLFYSAMVLFVLWLWVTYVQDNPLFTSA
eukprot:TRINITY_DN16720_c0_g1_i1.p1 TRINITY_DN16720_c0_g1~~TRINITY_DN16720_c0_g1_i1.p1  ORF type:complete len:332 (+),score=32.28 TRINITY_DN16720_c0_g1_i1:43-1038(+)